MPQFPQRASAAVLTAALLTLWISPACANPQFSHAEAGDIRIEESGAVYNIYSADKSIGAFTQFGNAAGETINSIQASADHSVIFKVTGGSPSEIFGAFNANSRVFLVNPSGILFRPGSQVNAPGLVAAAMDLKSADFDAREFRFEAPASGGYVLNEGNLNASQGGYLALVGKAVENRGSMTAAGGTAAMAAGAAATVGLDGDGAVSIVVTKPLESAVYDLQGQKIVDGVRNSGILSAEAGAVLLTADAMEEVFDQAINHEGILEAQTVEERAGRIILSAGAQGLARVDGKLDASGGPGEQGGRIVVTGSKTAITDDAQANASGGAGGGTILIGGGVGGRDAAVSNAAQTVVTSTAALKADALESGDGGTVVVWSDDATRFYGTLSAKGAGTGRGGFAEVSGSTLVEKGRIDVSAPSGRHGTILYDPLVIQITGGAADGDDTAGGGSPTILQQGTNAAGSLFFGDEGAGLPNPFLIYESEIEAASGNIVLEARRSITVSGTFGGGVVLLPANIDLSLETRNALTDGAGIIDTQGVKLQTQGAGDILISGASSGALTSTMSLGALETATGDIDVSNDNGPVTFFSPVTTTGGDFFVSGAGKVKFVGNITTSGGDVDIDSGTALFPVEISGNIGINTSAVTDGGDVGIHSTLVPSGAGTDFSIDARSLSTGFGGAVFLHGVLPNTNSNVFNDISVNSTATSGGGSIDLYGSIFVGDNGGDLQSVLLNGGSISMSSGVTVHATGAGDSSGNAFRFISDAEITLAYLNADTDGNGVLGNISLTATDGFYDGNGNLANAKASTLTFVSSLGDVGQPTDSLEVEYQTLNTTGVISGGVHLAPFYTEPSAAEAAGVILEGNRIVGGENFEEFTADSATVTEAAAEPAEEKTEEEEKGEEENAEGYTGPVQTLSSAQLIEAPASFPDEQPVQPSTFQTCAV